MKFVGTRFQVKVWRYLKKIPVGKTRTYSQVAKAIGKPLAVRAVASAIAKTPILPKYLVIELLDLMDHSEDTL